MSDLSVVAKCLLKPTESFRSESFETFSAESDEMPSRDSPVFLTTEFITANPSGNLSRLGLNGIDRFDLEQSDLSVSDLDLSDNSLSSPGLMIELSVFQNLKLIFWLERLNLSKVDLCRVKF